MAAFKKEQNTVLIAIINDKKDFANLHNELWYRIPIDKAPPIIRNRKAKIIAFYPTSKFGVDKWKIRYYGYISRITEVGRFDLFPNEPANSLKAKKRYYKVELERLLELPLPIISLKGHRIVFVPTSEHRFFNYTDLNFLFNGSTLEDRFFAKLTQANIPCERQWFFRAAQSAYYLDFAIFCKTRPIDVECDGDAWHDTPDRVHYDKSRNNELERHGWSVLRFTQDDIEQRMEKTFSVLYDTINRNGGYVVNDKQHEYRYLQKGQQLRLDF